MSALSALAHGLHDLIVIFDDRRMVAISALQVAQYRIDPRTNDSVVIDYVQLVSAVSGVFVLSSDDTSASLLATLEQARTYDGHSVIHAPVYCDHDPLGDMGAHGQWKVGNWVDEVRAAYRITRI